MIPTRRIRTARLLLNPVAASDLADLVAFKADPQCYAQMLGGVRTPVRTAEELAEDIAFWAARGVGIWTVRRPDDPALVGLTGVHERPDGRGLALRFAFDPRFRGGGLAREAAGAVLRFVHDQGRVQRVIAVARDGNVASRTVLGAIGMRPCETFDRDGHTMLVFESVSPPAKGI